MDDKLQENKTNKLISKVQGQYKPPDTSLYLGVKHRGQWNVTGTPSVYAPISALSFGLRSDGCKGNYHFHSHQIIQWKHW